MKKAFLALLTALLLSGCAVQSAVSPAVNQTIGETAAEPDTVSSELEEVTLARVVDGDTIKVNRSGEEVYVRLIGVDCPESVHADADKNTPAGEKASDYTKGQLTEGQSLWLEKDVSDTDQYGRLLRYVWTTAPDDPADQQEIRDKMYNARLLLDGYANAYQVGKDKKNYALFLQLELEANEASAGLWAESGLSTENLETARQQRLEQQEAVEGEYAYIGNAKSRKYHTLTCPNLPAEQNRVYFQTKEQAEEAGYSPCGTCQP